MKIREISSVNDFKSIRGTWNNLLVKSHDKNIVLTWERLFVWWERFRDNKKLKIRYDTRNY